MSLSTSRQQFLAYEPNGDPEVQYGRKGGVFISTCICISFVIFAVLAAVLVGVIVYFITFFKVSKKPPDFWNEMEPFGQTDTPSPDLRLPPHIVPSFYRLKLKADLEKSSFTGEVYITIRASKPVKEIVLHSKNLSINSNAKLTEQIYENETIHTRTKREVQNMTENYEDTTEVFENVTYTESTDFDNVTTEFPDMTTEFSNITTELPVIVTEIPQSMDTQVTHSNVRNIEIISISEGSGDRLILSLASALTPGVDYILELSFQGQILNSLTGFYKSSYVNNNSEVRQLGVTQFEPTSARAAFPCFDEPAFKAQFEISIAHPQNIVALSNMKVATHESIPDQPDWQWTHFERSVRMSTYLVAYILSDFVNIETTYMSKDNVTKTIKVWARPELISKAKYALSITPKLLAYYEDVFGLPYALDKLDLIAIPDFSSDAMENWGLITFRETTLLFDEKESVPRDKQNVAIDIAHELAHQWFGNLVTMRWWTDLWLNEGFATYIEYVGVDKIEPEWNMFDSFSHDKMELLRTDALKNTSPVSRQVLGAAEISQKFDEISYTKGANLIRMLNHTISDQLFYKGLAIYLNKWKYQNAEENDLWEAMSEATREDPALKELSVVKFMNSWTRQAGYPVVNVNRNYDTGYVTFQQKLFTSAKYPYPSMADQLWRVPISYATMDAPGNWSSRPQLWLDQRTASASLPVNESQALYVNVNAIGYYRVNYDQRNWQLLRSALHSRSAPPLTTAQLLDDAFNLAKAGQLRYTHALGLTTCVVDGEDAKTVWDTLLNNMAFLNHNLRTTPGYVYFQDYMRLILSKQLAKMNYGLVRPKDDNEAFLVESLVMWECMVEAPRCLNWARAEFEKWAGQDDLTENPIPSYLRAVVYNTVIKFGGRREFEFFWRLFHNATDPVVKSLAIANLPSTREEALVAFLLEKSLSEIPKQYAVSAWSVDPPVGTRVAQQLLLQQFPRVHARFTAMDAFSLPSAIAGAFGVMTTVDELDTFKSFALEHKEKLMPMSQTLQKIVDSANIRIEWNKKYAREVNQWFQDYVTEHAPGSSFSRTEQPLTQNITINISESTTSTPLNETTTTKSTTR
ncbi:aminopeptidase N-like [Epargyreus clarus]|uniref:aminopeptidase N-like n=1 Tax=Epargyreus clarus TaxID=520877 RepID=UPI003C2ABD16